MPLVPFSFFSYNSTERITVWAAWWSERTPDGVHDGAPDGVADEVWFFFHIRSCYAFWVMSPLLRCVLVWWVTLIYYHFSLFFSFIVYVRIIACHFFFNLIGLHRNFLKTSKPRLEFISSYLATFFHDPNWLFIRRNGVLSSLSSMRQIIFVNIQKGKGTWRSNFP